MKNKTILGTLFTMLIGLAGCNYESPEGASSMLLEAAKKNDLKLWKEALIDSALKYYGDAAGLKEIRDEISKYKKIDLSKPELLDSTKGQYGDTARLYRVEAFGLSSENSNAAKTPLARLMIECSYTYKWVQVPQMRRRTLKKELRTTTDCRIAEVIK